jgi:hypothetical protein
MLAPESTLSIGASGRASNALDVDGTADLFGRFIRLILWRALPRGGWARAPARL